MGQMAMYDQYLSRQVCCTPCTCFYLLLLLFLLLLHYCSAPSACGHG